MAAWILLCIFTSIQYLTEAQEYHHPCSRLAVPQTRNFDNLASYKKNAIPFDPENGNFTGNVVDIDEVPENLEKESFITLQSDFIVRLNLAYKDIKTIENGTFLSLFCVESLELQNNRIDLIESYAFEGLIHLRVLNLSHNALQTVPNLKNLTHLISLDLSFNKIHFFDVPVSSLISLKFMNISHNYIGSFDFKPWNFVTNLHILDLSYNLITDVYLESDVVFRFLTRILLNNNQLRHLSGVKMYKMAPNLGELTIESNNWTCDVVRSIMSAFPSKLIIYDDTNEKSGVDCTNETSTTPSTSSTTRRSTESPHLTGSNCTNVVQLNQLNHQELVDAVSSLKTLVTCMFIVLFIFVLFEVIVKTGIPEFLAGRWRNSSAILDNSNIENIRLLPTNVNSL